MPSAVRRPPSAALSTSPAAATSGWNTTDVTVAWNWTPEGPASTRRTAPCRARRPVRVLRAPWPPAAATSPSTPDLRPRRSTSTGPLSGPRSRTSPRGRATCWAHRPGVLHHRRTVRRCGPRDRVLVERNRGCTGSDRHVHGRGRRGWQRWTADFGDLRGPGHVREFIFPLPKSQVAVSGSTIPMMFVLVDFQGHR